MSHVATFKNYIEKEFGILFPKDFALQEQENVIRIFSKTLMRMKASGYMGFVAGKVGTNGIEIKSEFIQLFGKNANKNIVQLNKEQAKDFVQAEFIKISEKGDGWKIAKFGRHVLGIGIIKDGKFYCNFIGKGRKRVENNIEI